MKTLLLAAVNLTALFLAEAEYHVVNAKLGAQHDALARLRMPAPMGRPIARLRMPAAVGRLVSRLRMPAPMGRPIARLRMPAAVGKLVSRLRMSAAVGRLVSRLRTGVSVRLLERVAVDPAVEGFPALPGRAHFKLVMLLESFDQQLHSDETRRMLHAFRILEAFRDFAGVSGFDFNRIDGDDH